MAVTDETAIADATSDIEAVEAPEPNELPFDLFDRQTKRTTKLLATSGEQVNVDGRHRWFDYVLTDPVVVTSVDIRVKGYSEYHEFEFRWWDASGKEKSAIARQNDGHVQVFVNDVCRQLSFRPPSVFFTNPQVVNVSVSGFTLAGISEAVESLREIDRFKEEAIEALQGALAGARAKVAAAEKAEAERVIATREANQTKGNINRLKKSLDDLTRQRAELIAQNSATDDSLKSSQARVEALDSESTSLQKRYNEIREQIVAAANQLKSLQENINLFPSEIVGYVDQGSRNIRQYLLIASIPILVIVVMFVLLVRGAADLTTVVTNQPKVNIEALMISRVPYVAIATAVITACYKISRVFISEIMKINTQRLGLTKISIIAKDVSNAAEHDLDLSPEEVYRLRTDLKMQLLMDHLKDYLSKDFRIELPKRLLGIIPLGREKVVAHAEAAPEDM